MAINYPIVNEGLKYVNGLKLSYLSATTFTVAQGQCRDSTNVNDIVLSSDVTINAATNGVGGLDQGTFAANSIYAVFVIGDSSKNNPVSALISTSATDPILPFGYDMVRRIGWIATNGDTHIWPFFQTGSGSTRRMSYDAVIGVVTAGNATTLTDVDCSAVVPSSALAVVLNTAFTPATAGTNKLKLRRKGSAYDALELNGTVNSVVSDSQVWLTVNSSGVFQYAVTNASDAATIKVASYDDEL